MHSALGMGGSKGPCTLLWAWVVVRDLLVAVATSHAFVGVSQAVFLVQARVVLAHVHRGGVLVVGPLPNKCYLFVWGEQPKEARSKHIPAIFVGRTSLTPALWEGRTKPGFIGACCGEIERDSAIKGVSSSVLVNRSANIKANWPTLWLTSGELSEGT